MSASVCRLNTLCSMAMRSLRSAGAMEAVFTYPTASSHAIATGDSAIFAWSRISAVLWNLLKATPDSKPSRAIAEMHGPTRTSPQAVAPDAKSAVADSVTSAASEVPAEVKQKLQRDLTADLLLTTATQIERHKLLRAPAIRVSARHLVFLALDHARSLSTKNPAGSAAVAVAADDPYSRVVELAKGYRSVKESALLELIRLVLGHSAFRNLATNPLLWALLSDPDFWMLLPLPSASAVLPAQVPGAPKSSDAPKGEDGTRPVQPDPSSLASDGAAASAQGQAQAQGASRWLPSQWALPTLERLGNIAGLATKYRVCPMNVYILQRVHRDWFICSASCRTNTCGPFCCR